MNIECYVEMRLCQAIGWILIGCFLLDDNALQRSGGGQKEMTGNPHFFQPSGAAPEARRMQVRAKNSGFGFRVDYNGFSDGTAFLVHPFAVRRRDPTRPPRKPKATVESVKFFGTKKFTEALLQRG
jgi:hypothetical protein